MLKTLWWPPRQRDELLAAPTLSIICFISLVFCLILCWKPKDFLYKSVAFFAQDWKWRIFGENWETGQKSVACTTLKGHRKWAFHGHWWRVYRPDFLFSCEILFLSIRLDMGVIENFENTDILTHFPLKINRFSLQNPSILRSKLNVTDFWQKSRDRTAVTHIDTLKRHRIWTFHGHWWRVYRPDFFYFFMKNIFINQARQECDREFREYRYFDSLSIENQ